MLKLLAMWNSCENLGQSRGTKNSFPGVSQGPELKNANFSHVAGLVICAEYMRISVWSQSHPSSVLVPSKLSHYEN